MWLMLAAAPAGGLDLMQILTKSSPVSKGVFVVLVLCSVLSIAVIIERWIVFNRARRATEEARQALEAWAMAQQYPTARAEIETATRDKSPLFSALRAGIACWDELMAAGEGRLEAMEAMTNEAIYRELKLIRSSLRANLPFLANIASVAPFIGLFGTVVGIVLTFDAIARQGNMGMEMVGSGIADALIATAMGLFAAIPAVVAYNVFSDKINQLLLTIEHTAMERIYFLAQSKRIDGQVRTKE